MLGLLFIWERKGVLPQEFRNKQSKEFPQRYHRFVVNKNWQQFQYKIFRYGSVGFQWLEKNVQLTFRGYSMFFFCRHPVTSSSDLGVFCFFFCGDRRNPWSADDWSSVSYEDCGDVCRRPFRLAGKHLRSPSPKVGHTVFMPKIGPLLRQRVHFFPFIHSLIHSSSSSSSCSSPSLSSPTTHPPPLSSSFSSSSFSSPSSSSSSTSCSCSCSFSPSSAFIF